MIRTGEVAATLLPPMDHLFLYCADVGPIKQGNFGWAREEVPAGPPPEKPKRMGGVLTALGALMTRR